MKSMAKIIVLGLVVLGLSRITHADSKDSPQDALVRVVVDEYCRAELNGNEAIRQDLATYSRKRLIEEKKRNPELVAYQIISWEGDPLYVVSGFKVLDIKIEKKSVVASVDYTRLARTEGIGHLERKIIPDYKEHDVLSVNLVFEKGKWKILDPPQPRVSKEALLSFYKNEKKEFEEYVINNPKAKPSEPQKKGYVKVKETLEILEKLGKRRNKWDGSN